MSFYKNINVIRVISDLKNGLPISVILKHKALQTSSKKFYFAKQTIHPQVLLELEINQIISTKERKAFGKDDFTVSTTEEPALNEVLELLKIAELEPILAEVETLPEMFQGMEVFEANLRETLEFKKNFIYELKLVAEAPIQLKYAENCEFFVFRTPLLAIEHYIIKIGNPEKDKTPLVRIHSSCYTGDLLASLRCDCRDQLQEAIKFINTAEGFNGGYVLYLMQEGRGIGLANKIHAYKLQQKDGLDTVESNLALGFLDDERSFAPAAKMLHFLNINEVCLITNNPKKAEDLEKLEIKVKNRIHTFFSPNEHNKEYLEVKQEKMGHSFK